VKVEHTDKCVFRYRLKKSASEFLAYGCEEFSQVLHAVRKHTMWYGTYSCITMPIFAALGVLSAVKSRSDHCCKDMEHYFLTGGTCQWNTAMYLVMNIIYMYTDM
jgi:hypothetical protein